MLLISPAGVSYARGNNDQAYIPLLGHRTEMAEPNLPEERRKICAWVEPMPGFAEWGM